MHWLESSLNDYIFAWLSSHMVNRNLIVCELRRFNIISNSKNVHFNQFFFHHSHEKYTNAAKFNKYDNTINTRINYFSIHEASVLNHIRYSREREIYECWTCFQCSEWFSFMTKIELSLSNGSFQNRRMRENVSLFGIFVLYSIFIGIFVFYEWNINDK